MPEALEWFQCRGCGRRQRWRADIAGKTVLCSCGTELLCPEGAKLTDTIGGGDTIIEDVDSPTAVSPSVDGGDVRSQLAREAESAPRAALSPAQAAMAKRASTRFLIWTVLMLVGLSLAIHAVITQWPIYIGLTLAFFPVSLWQFVKAKRRFQRGRRFWDSVGEALGA